MERPLATCYKCSTTCEYRGFTTFSYWWCPKCKDEPADVKLVTIRHPKGEKYGYAAQDGDIKLSSTGIYKLTYLDGSIEWYERSPGCVDIVLSGGSVRSAKRLAKGDLPSRKPMQLATNAGSGENAFGGSGVRPFPNPANSVSGPIPSHIQRALDSDITAGALRSWRYDLSTDTYLFDWSHSPASTHSAKDVEQYAATHPANFPSSNGSALPPSSATAVQILAENDKGVQQREVCGYKFHVGRFSCKEPNVQNLPKTDSFGEVLESIYEDIKERHDKLVLALFSKQPPDDEL